MGLTENLALTGNQFTNAASAFWIAVLLFEFPNSKHSAASWWNLEKACANLICSLHCPTTTSGQMAFCHFVRLGDIDCMHRRSYELRRTCGVQSLLGHIRSWSHPMSDVDQWSMVHSTRADHQVRLVVHGYGQRLPGWWIRFMVLPACQSYRKPALRMADHVSSRGGTRTCVNAYHDPGSLFWAW